MQETEEIHALEKEMATHSSVLAWRIPRDGGAWWAAVYGAKVGPDRVPGTNHPGQLVSRRASGPCQTLPQDGKLSTQQAVL